MMPRRLWKFVLVTGRGSILLCEFEEFATVLINFLFQPIQLIGKTQFRIVASQLSHLYRWTVRRTMILIVIAGKAVADRLPAWQSDSIVNEGARILSGRGTLFVAEDCHWPRLQIVVYSMIDSRIDRSPKSETGSVPRLCARSKKSTTGCHTRRGSAAAGIVVEVD